MKTAVIIEDESHAMALLARYLEKYCQVTVIGKAENVVDGVKVIQEKNPDIVLLDISLPDHNGFELIKRLQPITFEVIFVTAYDQYALQAIRLSAVDYLLKPVDISELRDAVNRAAERIEQKHSNQNLLLLIENLQQPDARRIAIPNGSSYLYEDISNIVRLHAQGRYTEIYTTAPKKYFVSKNLGEYDKLLSQYRFLRVHHSHLVNPMHISSFEKQDGGFLVMKDKSLVEVSRRNRDAVISFLKKSN
jgi:two-component system, LytTR family, response regulator